MITKRKNLIVSKQSLTQEVCKATTFRSLSTLPTLDDIHCAPTRYLRPIKTTGSFADGEEYLDIQFRLLREDLISPLRNGIREIRNETLLHERKEKLGIYSAVKIVNRSYTYSGITNIISFDCRHRSNIRWEFSRRLMSNNLLCMSKDGFQTMIFATVARRDIQILKEGRIEVRFADVVAAEEYATNNIEMTMVESSVFYEAYKHVLEGLKKIKSSSIPFSDYIVKCEAVARPPRYLRQNQTPLYDLNEPLDIFQQKIQILEHECWPSFEETCLNETQLKAFKYALTNEFVVIQGPPGTGKTYLGLRIADALLRNRSCCEVKKEVNASDAFMKRSTVPHFLSKKKASMFSSVDSVTRKTPVLIVCYTNHALDQFLTGLVNKGYENVIRVGGKVSDNLRKYSLFEVRKTHRMSHDGLIRRCNGARGDIHRRREELAATLSGSSTAEEFSNKVAHEKFIHDSEYKHMLTEFQFQWFQEYNKVFQRLEISPFTVFLGLSKTITYRDIERIHTSELTKTAVENSNQHMAVTILDVKKGENQQTLLDLEDGEISPDYEDDDAYKHVLHGVERSSGDLHEIISQRRCLHSNDFTYEERSWVMKRGLTRHAEMSEQEAGGIDNPWMLNLDDRWRLYKYWLSKKQRTHVSKIITDYENTCAGMQEIYDQEDKSIIMNADVVAMTTTGAAKYRHILAECKPRVVIIEEAAEVLEAHVITSLTSETEHVILIGDHKQLKPKPSVYKLAKDYNLDLSLFERMVNNGVEHHVLSIQHRMRPEVASLLKHIYPNLTNADSVQLYQHVKGVEKNLFFFGPQGKRE